MTTPLTYITHRRTLQNFVQRLSEQDRIALDTEFVGEDSFVPRLELIQVAAGPLSAVINFPAVGSLDDFGVLLADALIEKVVHAGRQDLELFYTHTGKVPAPYIRHAGRGRHGRLRHADRLCATGSTRCRRQADQGPYVYELEPAALIQGATRLCPGRCPLFTGGAHASS